MAGEHLFFVCLSSEQDAALQASLLHRSVCKEWRRTYFYETSTLILHDPMLISQRETAVVIAEQVAEPSTGASHFRLNLRKLSPQGLERLTMTMPFRKVVAFIAKFRNLQVLDVMAARSCLGHAQLCQLATVLPSLSSLHTLRAVGNIEASYGVISAAQDVPVDEGAAWIEAVKLLMHALHHLSGLRELELRGMRLGSRVAVTEWKWEDSGIAQEWKGDDSGMLQVARGGCF